jgi:4-aminobutyrate aminotransferase-like enzyme/Ser/Thr protein kinase RdoA (MazF antagonist)
VNPVPSFDFFEQGALPAPEIPAARAELLARERYGVDGAATELGSQQDANFLIDAPGGRYVLKVSNPGRDGRPVQPVSLGERTGAMRLVTFLDGEVLSEARYLAPSVVASLGDLAGRTSRALATFAEPIPPRVLQWDLRYAREVVTRLAGHAAVPGGAGSVRVAAAEAAEALAPYAEALPVQPVHGDLTDDNVIATVDGDGRRRPVGVIDFGDLTESWAIAELAVTCSSLLWYAEGDLTAILPAVRAFDHVRPVSDDELSALWPLIVLRAAALMVSGRQQASVDGGNAYAAANLDREWRIFERSVSVPIAVGTELVRSSVRPPGPRPAVRGRPLLSAPGGVVRLDLSVTSPGLHGGRFLEDGAVPRLAAEALARTGSAVAYVPYLRPRLTRTVLNTPEAPATAGLGVEVFAAGPLEIRAPWAGVLEARGGTVSLRSADEPALWLSADGLDVADGTAVEAGDPIGRITGDDGPATLRVQAGDLRERPPFFVTAAMAGAWARVCPDPAPLIDPAPVPDEDPPGAGALLARRDSAFAAVQEHYYAAPPRIERGWRHHLFDVGGRAYLDMVNNVSILGHGHPRLADAIAEQWRLLNTNSRFHYLAVVEFSERLAALLPDPLDTVFLVNSGTEAVDLALRLAWAATGRRDVVAVREAYHGWSDATDAISTSVADNPNALDTRPSWVHTVAAPNAYRGRYRGAEAHRYAEDAVAEIEEMTRSGRPPAAFLAEPFYGNAGGMALPDGYLRRVYAAVRRAGGLCAADEVQAGYGRLGHHFWGFEQQGVVPDIVTVAKAMGNGHPLGAVVTTRAVAERFRGQGYFFSSAGGSPVSCVAGLTVLDVLRDEGLQENARVVGDHLRRRLLALADRHPIVGAVHGMGLYLGAEMVRDRTTLEPATEETAAICERMRELGVVMQPTSDRMCVLKIKPPLGIGIADADFFADTLDRVLTEGW